MVIVKIIVKLLATQLTLSVMNILIITYHPTVYYFEIKIVYELYIAHFKVLHSFSKL